MRKQRRIPRGDGEWARDKTMDTHSALVHEILKHCSAFTWTVQGLGMLRTKLGDVGRIHVWDSRLAVRGVSTMHAHPWPLQSWIISGELINQRYVPHALGRPYVHSRLLTGEGGGLTGETTEINMLGEVPEFYTSGYSYAQTPKEVHRSIPQDGTVTLIRRPMEGLLQETDVYWPKGSSWISAEPRLAKASEVADVIGYALSIWNPV